MLESEPTDAKYTGFICDFDVTGALLNGDNTYKIYLTTAQEGSGSKLAFCSIPADTPAVPGTPLVPGDINTNPPTPEIPAVPGTAAIPSPRNTCEYWENYDDAGNDISDFSSAAVALNVIWIKRNASNNAQIDIKVGASTNAWVIILLFDYFF